MKVSITGYLYIFISTPIRSRDGPLVFKIKYQHISNYVRYQMQPQVVRMTIYLSVMYIFGELN